MDLALDAAGEEPRHHRIALNAADIERINRAGKMAAVLDMEGSFDLDGDLGVLRDFTVWVCGPFNCPRTTGPTTTPIPAARRRSGTGLNERGRGVDPRDEPAGHGDQRVARVG